MKHNSDIHHRRSIRLKGYDYSQSGAYFITICARNKECLFGEIAGVKMVLNDAGAMAHDEWVKTSEMRQNIKLDEFVVMPNHIHGIIRKYNIKFDTGDNSWFQIRRNQTN